MFDADAPSSLLVIDQLGKPTIRARLLAIAKWSTGSEVDAEDLLEAALVRVLDPDDVPWVPEKGSLLRHMGFVMRQVWGRQMRKAAARREVVDTSLARDETTPSAEPSPDEDLQHHRTMALWRSVLEEVLGASGDKHPLLRPICDLAARGVDEPAEQAKILGCKVEEVYRAFETLKYHARRALEARDLAEQRRMKDLREAATKGKDEAIL